MEALQGVYRQLYLLGTLSVLESSEPLAWNAWHHVALQLAGGHLPLVPLLLERTDRKASLAGLLDVVAFKVRLSSRQPALAQLVDLVLLLGYYELLVRQLAS